MEKWRNVKNRDMLKKRNVKRQKGRKTEMKK